MTLKTLITNDEVNLPIAIASINLETTKFLLKEDTPPLSSSRYNLYKNNPMFYRYKHKQKYPTPYILQIHSFNPTYDNYITEQKETLSFRKSVIFQEQDMKPYIERAIRHAVHLAKTNQY